MLFLALLLTAQSPSVPETRLSAPSTDRTLVVIEPTDPAPRVILFNDGKSRVRVMQPYFEASAPLDGAKACELWTLGDKPHRVGTPTDGRLNHLLFRDADITLAPNERVELTYRCESLAAQKLVLKHVLVADTGTGKAFRMISRTPSPVLANAHANP